MASSGSIPAPSLPHQVEGPAAPHLVVVPRPRSAAAGAPDERVDASPAPTLRRAFDIVIASVALVALVPLFLVIAGLVKLTSPGPVFYRQARVGLERRDGERRARPEGRQPRGRRRRERRTASGHGQLFHIVKFRTMVVDAEATGPAWSTRRDPRVTPFGRLLRATRVDETPQFWNVLSGDMSLLGPRPERPYFVQQFVECIPRYRERLRVRPGITGQAQVSLAYDSSIDDVRRKLEQDLDWIERPSVRRDMAILVRTVGVVLTGRGAR